MATIVTELYEALLEAGASKEKAKATAEAMSENNERFIAKNSHDFSTKADLARLESRMLESNARLEAKLQMLIWIVGSIGFVIVLGFLKQGLLF